MTLRKKALTIIGATTICLIVTLYVIVRGIILSGFAQVEEEYVEHHVQMALNALHDEVSALDTTTYDWAAWDDTYAFIQDANRHYIESNLLDDTFIALRLNLMLFVNSSGRIVFGKAFDLRNEEEVPLPQGLLRHLSDGGILLRHPDTESRVTGFVLLPESPMLVASRPILTSDDEGPIRGTLIMGRYLDSTEVMRLGEKTRLSLAVQRYNDSQMPLDFQAVRSSLSGEMPILVRPLGSKSIAGYALLRDIYGNPALVLRVDESREIYEQGQTSLRYLVWLLLITGLVFGAVTLLLLEKQVLSRLTRLSESVRSIGANGDLSARVSVTGRDELSSLASAINGMLQALERSQAALRRSEERYRAVAETTFAGISIADSDENLIFVNPAFVEMLGYTQDELLGMNLSQLMDPEEFTRYRSFTQQRRQGGRDYNEISLRRKDGAVLDVLVSASPLTKVNGGSEGTLAAVIDVTERKRLEEQLLQAQKMEAIGRLAGGVAHDFNNLLTTIIGYSELLLDGLDDRDPLRSDVEEIRKAGQRAASLTRQLLAFSRRQPLERKVLDLNAVVTDMEKMLRRLIGEDIDLVTSLEPALAYVEADPGQIGQVIMNLVINARDAMPEGGKLIIKTENVSLDEEYCRAIPEARPGNFVCMSVEDSGIGMERETLRHLFEPFFTTKGNGRGTGLGLAVVYGIVKQHEGWINVYSRPGQGSTFRIYLPTFEMEPEQESEEPIVLQGLQGTGQRILLVEDEEGVRRFAAKVLSDNGYVVLEATSAREALALFVREKGKFHLVFSDVVLPDEPGLELVDQLLSRRPGLAVLLCSGYMDQKSQWPIIRERGFRFIQKPFALADLLRAVREAIERG